MAQAKYTPIEDRVNVAVALIQAANALDVAAKFAVESRDSGTLIEIAHQWVELSKRLVYDDEEEGPEEESDSEGFGFSLVSDTEREEEVNGGSERSDCGEEDDCD